jgi:hypothetical protein
MLCYWCGGKVQGIRCTACGRKQHTKGGDQLGEEEGEEVLKK